MENYQSRNIGVTLVEIIISLAVLSILSTIAFPAFLDLIRSNRLTTQTYNFVTAMRFARTQSIQRNVRIVICASKQYECEETNQWQYGWIVFADQNKDLQPDDGAIIREFPSLALNYTLTPNVNTDGLAFYPSGNVRRGSGALPMMTFRLCAPDAKPGNISSRSREIVFNATGRMRVQFGREGKTTC